jgi:hypothetical protein
MAYTSLSFLRPCLPLMKKKKDRRSFCTKSNGKDYLQFLHRR